MADQRCCSINSETFAIDISLYLIDQHVPCIVNVEICKHCKRKTLSDLTIIGDMATRRRVLLKWWLYFNRSLCYIQAGKKSLKISGAIIRNTANLRKML